MARRVRFREGFNGIVLLDDGPLELPPIILHLFTSEGFQKSLEQDPEKVYTLTELIELLDRDKRELKTGKGVKKPTKLRHRGNLYDHFRTGVMSKHVKHHMELLVQDDGSLKRCNTIRFGPQCQDILRTIKDNVELYGSKL